MPSIRTVRRAALAVAVLTLASVVPAAASSTSAAPSATPAARSGSTLSAVDRVADFYGAYIDAVYDGGSGRLAGDLRNHYLTAGLRKDLAAWEKKNHADGVLRAQNVPTAWRVAYNDSGAGHTWLRVRLTWGSEQHPTYSYLDVQADLATKLISGIKAGTK